MRMSMRAVDKGMGDRSTLCNPSVTKECVALILLRLLLIDTVQSFGTDKFAENIDVALLYLKENYPMKFLLAKSSMHITFKAQFKFKKN